MRVKIKQEQKDHSYGASNSMTLALVTLYGDAGNVIQEYKKQRQRPSAYMKDCTQQIPTDNLVQQQLQKLCPLSKRVKLYVSEWGMREPSHYVILHKIEGQPLFRLACARLLRRLPDYDALIDGITIMWPDNNPEVACGQTPIIERKIMSGASASIEILGSPELQRELRLAVDVAHLYSNNTTVAVWGHPGKTVFEVTPDSIVLVRVRPHVSPPTKFNVILWGSASNNCLADAASLPRHIVPQIKGAEPYQPVDTLEINLLRWALDARLLPYVAISKTTTRGDIYTLAYDPDVDEAFITQIAANHKIVGLPRVLRINNKGHDIFVPDLLMAERLKRLFFDDTGGEAVHHKHTTAFRRLLGMTMGYKTWDDIALAWETWNLPLSSEEENVFEILRST